ncbi:MAG: TetR/AcrR family transcriptional regulator [Leptospiraceae bacterium]|nr:TetR/AcrR family transcriptional regulator [Leptospiraceae bacterium]
MTKQVVLHPKNLETKERLLAATLQILSKKGIHHTRIEDITKEAGLGKGTFYEYFSSKEEATLEVFNEHCKLELLKIKKIFQESKTPKEAFNQFLDLHFDNVEDNKDLVKVFIQLFSRELEDNTRAQSEIYNSIKLHKRYFSFVSFIGQSKGFINPDIDRNSYIGILFNFIDGFIMNSAFETVDKKEIDSMKKTLLDIFVNQVSSYV